MSSVKDAAKRVFNGFLFGLGFGVAAGSIYYLISEKMSETMMKSVWNEAAFEKVAVTAHEEVKRNDGTFILGTIENRSNDSVRMATIQVDLFDKTCKFVDQCSEHLTWSLKSHEARNFKVACGGKDEPVAEHDSYKLRVVGM